MAGYGDYRIMDYLELVFLGLFIGLVYEVSEMRLEELLGWLGLLLVIRLLAIFYRFYSLQYALE
ncbi:hypothetical protein [Helicobacter mesocricetorum]|uniref:hypothetical protein n=1 Tax=Helicobacter mesocricetorum TaxID=87012 RepID=UPI000CF1009E|nr:hypothetical protein [Helicobacter mesocricetorum]